MEIIKLNKNWAANKNASVDIKNINNTIEICILLDNIFDHIDPGQTGRIVFNNAYGYCVNQFDSLTTNGLTPEKNNFYELIGAKTNCANNKNTIIVDPTVDITNARHFILITTETVIECFAQNYVFDFGNNISELIEQKYPKGYFAHYFTMFTKLFDSFKPDNYFVYTNLYLQMQNKKEFENLKAEVKTATKNNDLNLYLKFANSFNVSGFDKKQLTEMLKNIENYKI